MKSEVIFNIIILLISGFIICAVFYYSEAYWVKYFPNYAILPIKYALPLLIGRVIGVLIAGLLISYRKALFSKRKQLILISITSCIAILILEITTQLFVCNFASDERKFQALKPGQCGYQSKFISHPYQNYINTPNYTSKDGENMHNSLGFRGPEIQMPKPSGRTRIVAIGESTTYSTGVKSWQDDFPRQLEKELKNNYPQKDIEVINAGVPGYTTFEATINLLYNVIELEPDMVIIHMGVNDADARFVNTKYFKSDNSGKRQAWHQKPTPLILQPTFMRLFSGVSLYSISQSVDTPYTTQWIISNEYNEILEDTPMHITEVNTSKYYERNIRYILAALNEYQITPILATSATHSGFNDHHSTQHYQKVIKQHNELIKQIGEQRQLLVVDFDSQISRDINLWADSAHLNKDGIKIKAEIFAQAINSANILK